MLLRCALSLLLALGGVTPVIAGEAGSASVQRPSVEYEQGVEAITLANYEKAIRLFDRVVDAEPDNADAWNYIGFSQRKLFRFEEALEAFQVALRIDPDHRGANEYLGELYLQTDQLDKARERLSRLDRVCFFGCEEYDQLKSAIELYEKR
ncbi:tetratricopeptide repeat protein [Aestuariirhabdus litorea]|uniref:Tetratricopeptide repeat protein n=1 Tax=Aestuariirhabdus litorea TaxID=2528527 RepID=A0A3P3VME7_9GAMM|nr:tetratricopeptide repeat protein [Aestuariirhabdus litorea]RRJ82836.1 tetratricopeptide repeat protein [Aestuariirhabdus litorea]RWW92995.1 tetratricopeptide repeat protein [Endozoicomonadaceae bacterium GTF-13]